MTSEQAEDLAASALSDYADYVTSLYPDAELPVVDRVRFVDPSEYGVVFSACMTEAGFAASVTADNGLQFEPIPDEQAEAQTVALYACRAKYPTHPRFLRAFTEEQLQYLYRYSSDTVIPCLEDRGIAVPELPSESIFKQNYGGDGAWFPYQNALAMPVDELNTLMEQCPAVPEQIWG